MVKIGLTGGIGSGKSTVLQVWESKGAFVVKADRLAKKIMRDDPELKNRIIELFGKQSYDDDGSLNREYLAREAFAKGRVEELNDLVHPKVHQYTLDKIKRARQKQYKAFVKEAALLLQEGRPDYLDIIVLVKAERSRRIKWVSERDQVPSQKVEARMKRQQTDQQMEHMADYTLENNGTIDALRMKARELYQQLVQ